MNDWHNLRRDETPEWMQALKWIGVALAIGLGVGVYVLWQGRPTGAKPAPLSATAITPLSLSLLTPLVPTETILLSQPTPPARVAQGVPAPDFTLTTLNGESTVILLQLKGQPVLINFWASWCIPCRTETPALERAYQKYQSEGLVILGINSAEQDTLKEASAFAEEFQVSYPLLWDETDMVLRVYGLLGLPTSIFINSAGLVQRIYIGGMNADQIEDFIGEIIG